MIPRLCRAILVATSLAAAAAASFSQPAIGQPASASRLTLAELRARYGDPAGRTMQIGGVDVYYKDEGRGPTILAVHGSNSTLKTWDGVVARLKHRYRIIRYDVPPWGLSGPVSDAAAATLKPADIAEQLLERLGVTHAVVVGVSSGGTLGVMLAAKRPDMVDRLVLSDAPADPVDTSHLVEPPTFLAAQKEATRTHFQSQVFWDEFLDYFSGRAERISSAVRTQYYDFNRRTPEPNLMALVARVENHPAAVAAMAQVRAPTLLLWGAADPLLPPSAAAVLQNYLVHSQVSVLLMPDVGHYPPIETPDRFADALNAYLQAVAPVAPN